MDALISWLRELGLERYGDVFTENDVDVDVLRLLTDAEVNSLGVSLGRRNKKLPQAIGECSQPVRAPGSCSMVSVRP